MAASLVLSCLSWGVWAVGSATQCAVYLACKHKWWTAKIAGIVFFVEPSLMGSVTLSTLAAIVAATKAQQRNQEIRYIEERQSIDLKALLDQPTSVNGDSEWLLVDADSSFTMASVEEELSAVELSSTGADNATRVRGDSASRGDTASVDKRGEVVWSRVAHKDALSEDDEFLDLQANNRILVLLPAGEVLSMPSAPPS
eukprot:gnl/Hemi2/8170_TR2811_c0_g1_i1.p1 gnl/Hemi2/8170_TR2811_c0_g1~~gnl/Hemi2/8170_TR2811_c0_g1_i1.p1  ORF type:complete len:199 (-),score=60.04 gnl/Hemi2/8170_TR2811_c0_g1_i1:353-949(-)